MVYLLCILKCGLSSMYIKMWSIFYVYLELTKIFWKELSLHATNWNLLIPQSLQPGVKDLIYFKLLAESLKITITVSVSPLSVDLKFFWKYRFLFKEVFVFLIHSYIIIPLQRTKNWILDERKISFDKTI